MNDEMHEDTKEFLIECHENLGQLDLDLLALEKDSANARTLASVFRTIHTIKGSSGFLGFGRLESLAHAAEGLLGRLRDGKLLLTPEIASALLAVVDAVRQMLAAIEEQGQEVHRDDSALIATLTALREGRTQQPSVAARDPWHARDTMFGQPSPLRELDEAMAAREGGFPGDEDFILQEVVRPPLDPPATAPSADVVGRRALEPQPREQPAYEGLPTGLLVNDPPAGSKEPAVAVQAVSDGTVRIGVELLDKLMNLVSELVLARNQILQYGSRTSDPAFVNLSRHLNLITTELQEEVMQTRMQPIGNIWNKFPRMVRDVALTCGKRVRLEMEGNETELDKTIIEAIKDPLTHLVRNCVDHGIESSERRAAAGKPADGLVSLRAFHEGGQVNIVVADDGAGINPERVKAKAIERGLITPEQAAQTGEQTLVNLIFLPGFSTSDKVSHVSGRGVGMDVVKTNVEKIGGAVDIQSRLGAGTVIKMRIPLTLAIVTATIVTDGPDRYAIAQNSILELLRLEGEKARHGIEQLHGVPVLRYRGKLLPIVYLNRVLQTEQDGGGPEQADDRVINIVVLQADGRRFGLVVDRIKDTQEIVVKPLAKQLKGIPCFAGATIMGDGRVALILDVAGLAQQTGVAPKLREAITAATESPAAEPASNRQSAVLVRTRDAQRMAIPLEMVARLEKFPRAAVERVGGQDVVQYRGEILPLVDVSSLPRSNQPQAVVERPMPEDDSIQVVVCSHQGQSAGLVVDCILDIIEQELTVKGPARREHVLFSAVVQDRVTEFLDLEEIVRSRAALSPEAAAAI